MITVRVAILDDEKKDSSRVKEYFHAMSNQQIQYHCDEYTSVNHQFYDHYDLYVVDIELENISGLDIAREIKQKCHHAVLIIYSKRNDLVFESFKIGCFFFIRKEFFNDDMQYAYDRLRKHFLTAKRYYRYESKGIVRNIAYDSIEYIEKIGHDIEIHLENGEVLIERKTLKNIMNEIVVDTFIQCHQSYYVNLSKVQLLNQNDFVMTHNTVQISQRYYAQVKKKYVQYLSRCLI